MKKKVSLNSSLSSVRRLSRNENEFACQVFRLHTTTPQEMHRHVFHHVYTAADQQNQTTQVKAADIDETPKESPAAEKAPAQAPQVIYVPDSESENEELEPVRRNRKPSKTAFASFMAEFRRSQAVTEAGTAVWDGMTEREQARFNPGGCGA